MSTAAIAEVDYPDSDGEPLAETPWHLAAITYLLQALKGRYADRDDVYVAADSFLYYVEGDNKSSKAPDVMVAFGVRGNADRGSFKTWVEGVAPTVIVEVTSPSTYSKDLGDKLLTYADLGVAEYYLYDPLSQTRATPFLAKRLADGRYRDVATGVDGGVDSPALGLRLVPEGILLRLVDIETGEPLPTADEYRLIAATQRARAKAHRRRAETERQRAETESLRADLESQRAETQRQRADDLAAEVARLKVRLGEA